jgi:hypothetical protein
MKGVFWFLLLVLAFLFGLLLYTVNQRQRLKSRVMVFEVTPESVQVFQRRVAELESSAVVLRNRLSSSSVVERLLINRRLGYLERQIEELKLTLDKWRATKDLKSAASIYYKCLLIYGKASGVCELLASETLPPARRER